MHSIKDDFVFPVYIFQSILSRIFELCSNSNVEILGYLIGTPYQWSGKQYIVIVNYIHFKDSIKSSKFKTSQITGTAGLFQKRLRELRSKHRNDNLYVVGWWHSHLGIGPFLSSTDVRTQEFFFPNAQQVALVIDPLQNEFRFFTFDKNSPKHYKSISYALISPEGKLDG